MMLVSAKVQVCELDQRCRGGMDWRRRAMRDGSDFKQQTSCSGCQPTAIVKTFFVIVYGLFLGHYMQLI